MEHFLLVLSGFMLEVINCFHEQSDAVKSTVTVLIQQTARDKAKSKDKGVMLHQHFNGEITHSEDRGTTISASVSYVFFQSAYAALQEQTEFQKISDYITKKKKKLELKFLNDVQ